MPDPVVTVLPDEWTAVPGTPLELHQASGASADVYRLDTDGAAELAVDVYGPVRIRIRQSETIVTRQFGVKMIPNSQAPDAPTTPSVREQVGRHQAEESAAEMNELASGYCNPPYWVKVAQVVTRTRHIMPDTSEYFSPWMVVIDDRPQMPSHPFDAAIMIGDEGKPVPIDACGYVHRTGDTAQFCTGPASDPLHQEEV